MKTAKITSMPGIGSVVYYSVLLNRITCFFFLLLFLFSGCTTIPLSRSLSIDRPPRLGIIGFKVTAPVKYLSSIIEKPPENLDLKVEAFLISKELNDIEDRAMKFMVEDLKEEKKVEPVVIPEGLFGMHRGERPTAPQLDLLQKELGVDAVLYGEIPWYGKTRLIYPILGETLDVTAESIAIGVATQWNPVLIFGNIGFEVLTSTPLWFGGAYILGLAFRPVTVEAWVLSVQDGHEIWHKSADRIVSRKILKSYPESERPKKEIQLEASLRRAVSALSKSLSR